jgi:hypothetical protein
MSSKMCLATSGGFTHTGDGLYRKDVIRTGRWFVPHMGVWLDVDAARLDHWAQQFTRMKAAGVSVDLTVDHRSGAEAKRGETLRLEREGDTLYAVVRPADEDSEALLRRCGEVSIEVERELIDGRGTKFSDAITAVSVCRKPVVTGQQPFERIAASRSTTDSGAPVFRIAAPDNPDDWVLAGLAGRANRRLALSLTGNSDGMAALKSALGDNTLTESNVVEKVIEAVKQMKREAGEPEPDEPLSTAQINALAEFFEESPEQWSGRDWVEKLLLKISSLQSRIERDEAAREAMQKQPVALSRAPGDDSPDPWAQHAINQANAR